MSSRNSSDSGSPTPLRSLNLPVEFEGLEGLLQADLKAVVNVLASRAHERLLLTRREHRQLQVELWNRLTEVIDQTMEPLTAEVR